MSIKLFFPVVVVVEEEEEDYSTTRWCRTREIGHVNKHWQCTTHRLCNSVVSVYPHRLLAFSQNVRAGEGSVPTDPTTGKLQSLMTSRAEKGTQDLMR